MDGQTDVGTRKGGRKLGGGRSGLTPNCLPRTDSMSDLPRDVLGLFSVNRQERAPWSLSNCSSLAPMGCWVKERP